MQQDIPTTHEIEEFFALAEQQQQKRFTEKYITTSMSYQITSFHLYLLFTTSSLLSYVIGIFFSGTTSML